MTVTFTPTDSAVTATAGDIVQSALYELNVLAPGEILQPGDAAWGLEKLQRLIDSWNAQRDRIFTVDFNTYALPINTQPVTYGPGGTFAINQRPVRLFSAALILPSGTSNIDLPIRIVDADWWAAQPIKNLTSTFPTHVYYSPDNPLGNLFFWPIPTSNYNVRLGAWVALTQAIGMTTQLGLPQGYWEAVVLTLAVNLASSYEKAISPSLAATQAKAVEAITSNNAPAPRITTAGAGIPRPAGSGVIPDYNFLVGPFGPRNY